MSVSLYDMLTPVAVLGGAVAGVPSTNSFVSWLCVIPGLLVAAVAHLGLRRLTKIAARSNSEPLIAFMYTVSFVGTFAAGFFATSLTRWSIGA